MPLDSHAKRLLDRLAATNPPSARSLSIGARRDALQHLLDFSGLREEVEQVENRTLPGPDAPLAVRVYTPTGAPRAPLPALVYFHGGGLVAGSLDSHDAICRSLTNASGCRLISVDYRLAPEHPFPGAIADGYAAAAWVARASSSAPVRASRTLRITFSISAAKSRSRPMTLSKQASRERWLSVPSRSSERGERRLIRQSGMAYSGPKA